MATLVMDINKNLTEDNKVTSNHLVSCSKQLKGCVEYKALSDV